MMVNSRGVGWSLADLINVCSYFPNWDCLKYNFQTLPKKIIKTCISLLCDNVPQTEKSFLDLQETSYLATKST
jgi:hypothetical protein